MPKPIPATLRFEDAPDMINIQQLSDILGVCHREASKLFNSKGITINKRMKEIINESKLLTSNLLS